jgi:hypothetical protein
MAHLNVWNIVRNDDLDMIGMIVELREGYGYSEPVYYVRYENGQTLAGLEHMYTLLAKTPQEWETMYSPETIAAAQKIVTLWGEIFDDGIKAETFDAQSENYRRHARLLFDLVSPSRGSSSMDWHPDMSSLLRIKVAAVAILDRNAKISAGNSGTH